MEYVNGRNLHELLIEEQDEHPHIQSLDSRTAMALEIARGMNFLHIQSPPIIHRDLKSANVLVDNNYHCKIIDFGLAKVKQLSSQCTSQPRKESAAGTLAFTAPEMLKGEVDPTKATKLDVYSFAIVLWQLKEMKIPYEDLHPDDVIRVNVISGVRPPLNYDDNHLTDLIDRCWNPQPDVRLTFREIVIHLQGICQVDAGDSEPCKEYKEDQDLSSEEVTGREAIPRRFVPTESPSGNIFLPQVGDKVVYCWHGHEQYIDSVILRNVYEIKAEHFPWQQLRLRAHEVCMVLSMNIEVGPPKLCLMKMGILRKEGKVDHKFSLTYHAMYGCPDFLIPYDHFKRAVLTPWKPGDRFQCKIDDVCWTGSIIAREPPKSAVLDSLWQCLLVQWDTGEEQEKLSPWDIEVTPRDNGEISLMDSSLLSKTLCTSSTSIMRRRRSSAIFDPFRTSEEQHLRFNLLDILSEDFDANESAWGEESEAVARDRILRGLDVILSHPISQPFRTPVKAEECPDYYSVIPYPIDLGAIKQRLSNGYYRRLNSFLWDLESVHGNAATYYGKDNPIVKSAKTVKELLRKFACAPQCTDPMLLYNMQEQQIVLQECQSYQADSPETRNSSNEVVLAGDRETSETFREELISSTSLSSDSSVESGNKLSVQRGQFSREKIPDTVSTGTQKLHRRWLQRSTPLNARDTVLHRSLSETGKPLCQLEPGLFQFMRIVEDRESEVVVVNVQEEILRFCKAVSVGCCSLSDPSSISFEALDHNILLTVTGMYGETSALLQFLSDNLGISSEFISSLSAANSKMSSGVYAFLPNLESLFLFYWSREISYTNYASSDISCQCIRYLQRLSHSIVLLFPPSGLHCNQTIRTKRQQQTNYTDIKVSWVVGCKEDVTLRPGFVVDTLCSRARQMPTELNDLVFLSGKEGFFVGFPKRLLPAKTSKSIVKTQSMSEAEYKDKFSHHVQLYHVDFSAIVDDTIQLKFFLGLTFPDYFSVWVDKEKSIETISASLKVDEENLMRMAVEERERRCRLWQEGVSYLFSELCPNEERALGIPKPRDVDVQRIQQNIRKEPNLEESFKDLASQITDAVIEFRKKGALADILFTMNRDNSLVRKLDAELFPLKVRYQEVLQKITSPHSFRWLYKFIKRQGMDQNQLQREVDAKLDESLLPSCPIVLEQFKIAYQRNVRQYFMSIERVKIPTIQDTIRVMHDELLYKANKDRNILSRSLEVYREMLRTEGINILSSQSKFSIISFQKKENRVEISYEEQYLDKEEIAYNVFQLQINRSDLQEDKACSDTPDLRLIKDAYVHLKKDDECLRGLYWIERHRKVIALVYSKVQKRLSVYAGEWQRLMKSCLSHFPRDCDAHAFDAERLLLVLCNNAEQVISLFQLTEGCTRLIPCSWYAKHEVGLQSFFSTTFAVKQMIVFEEEDEILLVGFTAQGFVYNMKRNLLHSMHYSFDQGLQRVLTIPGYLVEVYRAPSNSIPLQYFLRVHSRSSYEPLKAIPLPDADAQEVKCIQMLTLGPQHHLILPLANGNLKSFVIEATSSKSQLQFDSTLNRSNIVETTETAEQNSFLECFYSIFYKYPIRSCFDNDNPPLVLFCVHPNANKTLENELCRYMVDLLQELKEETGKATGLLLAHMEIIACTVDCCSKLMWRSCKSIALGRWIRELISSVPILIARSQDNRLLPLSKEIAWNFDLACPTMEDVSGDISFGLYESIFKAADAPVKVLSAKGNKSVDNRYLLNHVTGAQFNFQDDHIPHGVWMTVKALPNLTLVVLDFEGLGLPGTSRQEDMLLSLFGAAISSLTVFKTDCGFDRHTDVMFDRLQDGANKLKSGAKNKLFTGKFSILVRDVRKAASEVTIDNCLATRVGQICQTHPASNFLCDLYDGKFRIAASGRMGSSQFLQTFEQVKEELNDQLPVHEIPVEFMSLLKTVLAKIYLQDWTSIDNTRVVQKVSQLERNLKNAVMLGPSAYHTTVTIFDRFESLGRVGCTTSETAPSKRPFLDTGFRLLSEQDFRNFREREQAIAKFKGSKMAVGLENGSRKWLKKLSDFFDELVCGRIKGVQMWIQQTAEGYNDFEEIQQLMETAEFDYFRPLRQLWSICGEKCHKCNRFCVMPEYHGRLPEYESHSCGTDHMCSYDCSYCTGERVPCRFTALHSGTHLCKLNSHTCGELCQLDSLPGCNGFCSLPADHLQKRPDSQHICDAVTHYCGQECDLNVCKNKCCFPYDVFHDRHKCSSSNGCPFPCVIKGCSSLCSSTNHFHCSDRPNDSHFCDQEHPCSCLCEQSGLCGIEVQLVRVRMPKVLEERREPDGYRLFLKQKGVRKKCGKLIPAKRRSHEGPHVHAGRLGESFPRHICDQQCSSCLRFCERDYGHSGLHSTTHGNVTNQIIVSSEMSFYVGDNENGYATTELCDQFCKRLGRGHTHFIVCKQPKICSNTPHLRHNQRIPDQVLEDHEDLVLDEVTHDFYWKEMGFEDPCTESEQENYRKCNVVCARATVKEESCLPQDFESRYFCQLPLWHKPLAISTEVEHGHIDIHGHHFSCTHQAKYEYHTILIVDQSGSMSDCDSKPEEDLLCENDLLHSKLSAVLAVYYAFMESRYKCSKTDRYSLVTFSTDATKVFTGKRVSDGLITSLMNVTLKPERRTNIANALLLAKKAIHEVAMCYSSLSPVIIILSGGMAHDYDLALKSAKQIVSESCKANGRPLIHTIKFGCVTSRNSLLQRLADIGNGKMHLAQNQIELSDRFREFNELMSQGVIGAVRNIPSATGGLLDTQGQSWFSKDVIRSKQSSDSLAMLEAGNDMYQICGRRCIFGNSSQQNRILPLNLCDNGTIGDSLSIVFSIRHKDQVYRLKCLYRQKAEEEKSVVTSVSNELDCLNHLGYHRNVEAIRHSFEDRADIVFPWLDNESRSQSMACERAHFIVVDSYDQTLRELVRQQAGDPLFLENETAWKSWLMITLQLCSALCHLELKGVVHGSVTQDNIYMRTPTAPVLGNFERAFAVGNFAAVEKIISVKQREIGVTSAPELAVKAEDLAVDFSTSVDDCILDQVKKLDIFSLGVTMYNCFSSHKSQFPTERPYFENRLPRLDEILGKNFGQVVFCMVRQDPRLRSSPADSLLACQVLLSDLNLDEVSTNRAFSDWHMRAEGKHISEETESELMKEFLDQLEYRDILHFASLLQVS
jgi:serine/threonine protein kinase